MKDQELIIDIFAGGGGASEGLERGLGRPVDYAVNHDPDAIKMHAANHPRTHHFTEDVWKWNFKKTIGKRRVGVLWASPDCKHFSRAKGGKPVKKNIRSLAWVVPRIIAGLPARQRPRLLMLENVVEFADWGPIVPRWRCGNERVKRQTSVPGALIDGKDHWYDSCGWVGTEGQLRLAAGPRHRRACPRCDSPMVAQVIGKDGGPVFMPCPKRKGITFRRWVAKLKALGYDRIEWKMRDAADWGAPTHRRRLFLIARRDGRPIVWPEKTHADSKKTKGAQDLFISLKPYHTAAECIDWSLPVHSIFLDSATAKNLHIRRPLKPATEQRIAHGVKRFILDADEPFIVPMTHDNSPTSVHDPLQTITTQPNRFQLVVPTVVPLTHQGAPRGRSAGEPFPTITGAQRGEQALVAATMIQTGYGERAGQAPRVLDLRKPMGTAVDGCKQAVVAAFMAKHYGGVVGVPVTEPQPTTTMRGTQNQLVAAHLVHLNNGGCLSAADAPMRTVTAGGNHAGLVYAFLTRYFGTAIGQRVDEPVNTATDRARTGLVLVEVKGETMVIVDIGMRMFTPRELFIGNGFRSDYILTGTKTSQIARCGNSVPPIMPEVMTRANY